MFQEHVYRNMIQEYVSRICFQNMFQEHVSRAQVARFIQTSTSTAHARHALLKKVELNTFYDCRIFLIKYLHTLHRLLIIECSMLSVFFISVHFTIYTPQGFLSLFFMHHHPPHNLRNRLDNNVCSTVHIVQI